MEERREKAGEAPWRVGKPKRKMPAETQHNISEHRAELRRGSLWNIQEQCESRRLEGVMEGTAFLRRFLHHHFEDYYDHIQVISDITLEEIKMIGNEDQAIGVRQCRKLFNAPVLSDQIGYLLWTELRQGLTLDHAHDRRGEHGATDDRAHAWPMTAIAQEPRCTRSITSATSVAQERKRPEREQSDETMKKQEVTIETKELNIKAGGLRGGLKHRTAAIAGSFAASLSRGYSV
ncbi:hypothetical protein F5Y16DRAFT_400250 [Xylariaceae sp. FL0255]|nr:hypothetical protein F5Y16DRAFT_400250 [Xylariaceae sp. FL0255]